MAIRDPFGGGGDTDSEATVIWTGPKGPGIRATPVPAAAPPPRPMTAPRPQQVPKNLREAARPLLDLAVRLRDGQPTADVEALRQGVIAEIETFDNMAATAGLPPDEVRMARYLLAAMLDDMVLNTGWGERSVWASRSMVSTLFAETWGGKHFFDLIDVLLKDPGRFIELIELCYLCLALGFYGQYRVVADGEGRVARVRGELHRALKAHRRGFEKELSPRWRGVSDVYRPLKKALPLWVLPVVAAVPLVLVFLFFRLSLDEAGSRAAEALAQVPPVQTVQIGRSATPAPLSAPSRDSLYLRLSQALSRDIQAGLVAVSDGAEAVNLVIRGRGMFASGSDVLDARYHSLIDTIAQVLAAERAPVVVIGHTDSVPIATARFPDNQVLSLARAEAVAQRIRSVIGDPGRVHSEGRGEADPVADNATPQGRELNRRIEIDVVKQAVR
ncbi:MAG: DotU family type VI secretion system protein [Thalassobaculales bacterium]